LRDILFFELSLEIYLRQLVEKIIHIKIDYEKYIDEINLLMRNIKVSYPNYLEFSLCFNDWFKIVDRLKKDNSKEANLKVKSVVSRVSRLLSSVIDSYNNNFNIKAKYFGDECGIDKYYSDLFVEEILRGTIFFTLSILLKKIEPIIRKNAGLSDWLIISRGNFNLITGNLIYVKNLHEVQFKKYNKKTIIITENVNGNEEVPINCVGLIIIKTENYPDILAHVSVRARNLKILFCVCFNENESNEFLKLCNSNVKISILENIIRIENNNQDITQEKIKNEEIEKNEKLKLNKVNDIFEKIYLELDEFNSKSVGEKSNNSKKIFHNIPDCDFIKYPESFAIPFGVYDYFLSLPENLEIKNSIDNYITKIKSTSKINKKFIKKMSRGNS
jgi:alpha-glucan,water dikinase